MIPEINPNLHPLIIHFPIAFLTSAVIVDFISLFTRRWVGIRIAAVIVFTLGAVAALAAFLTGRIASDTVEIPAFAQSVVNDHADWAELTLWYFGIFALLRLGALWFDLKGRRWAQQEIHVVLFVVGAAGLFPLVQTGFLGGSLVYEHGIGVGEVGVKPPLGDEAHAGEHGEAARIDYAENGSWTWTPGNQADIVLEEEFRFLQGSAAELSAMAVDDTTQPGVMLHAEGGPVMLVAGEDLTSIQAETRVNLDDFTGILSLVHHVRDAQNYDFLAVSNARMQQGRMESGSARVFHEMSFDKKGMLTLRVVSDGTHFRGYLDGDMLTHGHGSEPDPGPVGFYLDGNGTVLLQSIQVQSLR